MCPNIDFNVDSRIAPGSVPLALAHYRFCVGVLIRAGFRCERELAGLRLASALSIKGSGLECLHRTIRSNWFSSSSEVKLVLCAHLC